MKAALNRRQRQRERRALVDRALEMNLALVFQRDAFGNRQTQARAVFFGREKRLEQPPQIFRRDATPVS